MPNVILKIEKTRVEKLVHSGIMALAPIPVLNRKTRKQIHMGPGHHKDDKDLIEK